MAFFDKDGPVLGKKCARCKSRFPRIGASCGLIGELFCFLLFGGTSKYCPSCREALKEQNRETEDGAQKVKLDKGPLFRLIWLIVVIGILIVIANA